LGLFGSFGQLNRGPMQALAANTSIAGVGMDPEGIDNNPAYYSFLLESAWRSAPVNTTVWLQDWGVQRCGRESEKVRQAWAILAETVYADSQAQVYEHHMGYCPTTMPEGSGWDRQRGAERPKYYEHSRLHTAWGLLIDAATAGECEVEGEAGAAFVFDLVDVGREWLSIGACNDASDALTNATTPAAVKSANVTMSAVMADIDQLLGSSFGFLLGPWIRDARALAPQGVTRLAGDADFLEWNARSQVTSWFPVDDCATRQTALDGLWDCE
jgi:alpha-N-acetylglucosaminidase